MIWLLCYFLWSSDPRLFRHVLFHFQVLKDCLVFLMFSCVIPILSENTLWMNPVLLNLLGFVLWVRTWSVRGMAQECLWAGAFVSCCCGMVCQYVSVHSILPAACVAGASVSFLSFCLVVLSVAQSAVLKSPAVVVDSSVSPFVSVRLSSVYCKALLGVSTAWIMSSC